MPKWLDEVLRQLEEFCSILLREDQKFLKAEEAEKQKELKDPWPSSAEYLKDSFRTAVTYALWADQAVRISGLLKILETERETMPNDFKNQVNRRFGEMKAMISDLKYLDQHMALQLLTHFTF